MRVPFKDRAEAGRALAGLLASRANQSGVQVLALPRGGVPVGFEVARALGAPLHAFLVRKLGLPGHEELAIGAIATGGVRVVNRDVVDELHVSDDVIESIAAREARELERRQRAYEGDSARPPVGGSTVILVDDGLATGSTMRAAIAALRREGPARIIVAVPVAARATCDEVRADADEVVCAATPEPFYAVGMWYEDFSQTTDEEVQALLAEARRTSAARPARASDGDPRKDDDRGDGAMAVKVTARGIELDGDLRLVPDARAIVLFAHGSGSSRMSPRNRYVAEVLNAAGIDTLLVDLLTAEEEEIDVRTAHLRFDIDLLADRLAAATAWLERNPETRALPIGYFGASTGAGAALLAAARRPDAVHAVVSRGGRPDLAGPALEKVEAPTLLIVGGRDVAVIRLNEEALARLRCEKRLEIVPGAAHLFEEPGTLETVARLARDWFVRHLAGAPVRHAT